MEKRILLLDKKFSICLRGIAAIFIMLGHLTTSCEWYVQILFSGSLWVGIFFFYTGYGLMNSYNSKERYLDSLFISKFKSVYIPFLIAETVYTLVSCIIYKKEFSIMVVMQCFGVLLSNSTLWYVVELMIIYYLFYIIYHVLKRKTAFFLWGIGFLGFVIVSVIVDIGTWWYISTSAFLMGLFLDKIKKLLLIF